ncbi:hypothetical protein HYY75_02395 [bacterium]|nr:hypothetical protein [bacterium]
MCATVILIGAIVPIYLHFSRQAGQNIETEKIQMADKMLQSIKEEMTAMPYKTIVERSKTANKIPPDSFELSDDLFPVTLARVLEVQKKFKDFKIEGTWMFITRGNPNDTNMVQVDAKVIWTQAGGKRERTRSFLLVAPR